MTRAMNRLVLAAAAVCLTAGAPEARQATTTTETKTFEVLAVDGNQLIVRLPEGTRELTVPDDFRFTVNGQPMSVRELKAGMKGTATITTKTTVYAGDGHRGEERHRCAADWFERPRTNRRGLQELYAGGYRQAGREDHPRRQAPAAVGPP